MKVQVSGKVHSLDPIRSPEYYARATFNTMDNLVVDSLGKVLMFEFTKPFETDSIDSLMNDIITESSNVEWEFTVR